MPNGEMQSQLQAGSESFTVRTGTIPQIVAMQTSHSTIPLFSVPPTEAHRWEAGHIDVRFIASFQGR